MNTKKRFNLVLIAFVLGILGMPSNSFATLGWIQKLTGTVEKINKTAQTTPAAEECAAAAADSQQRPLTESEKIRLIESLATPLLTELKTYSWFHSNTSAGSREFFYPHNFIFKRVLDEGRGMSINELQSANAFAGFGLYVSMNPSDSSEYSKTPRKLTLDDLDHLGQLPPAENKGVFKVVKIAKGQRLLDESSPAVQEAIASGKITFLDLYTLPADIAIKYTPSWINIRLRGRHAFSIGTPTPKDFLEMEVSDVLRLKKDLYRVQPFFTRLYDDSAPLVVTEYLKEKTERGMTNVWRGRRDLNVPSLSSFGDCIAYNQRGVAYLLDTSYEVSRQKPQQFSSFVEEAKFLERICREEASKVEE